MHGQKRVRAESLGYSCKDWKLVSIIDFALSAMWLRIFL